MAPNVTNYAEIQHDEIEALRSIYMEDFREHEAKAGAWNNVMDRSFSIKFKASTGEDTDATLTLSVSLPVTYPKSVPKLTLTFGEAVPSKVKQEAQEVVSRKPRTLLGSEMIFEIGMLLQDILDHAAQATETLTLDQERTRQVTAATEQQLHDVVASQDQEDAAGIGAQLGGSQTEQVQVMLEQVRSRADKRKNKWLDRRDESGVEACGGLRFDRMMSTRDFEGNLFEFDTIQKEMIRYREGPATKISKVYCYRETSGSRLEGNAMQRRSEPHLLLRESRFQAAGKSKLIKDCMLDLEEKLETLLRLKENSNVLQPLGYTIKRLIEDDDQNNEEWYVGILVRLAPKGSMRDLLDSVSIIVPETFRSWALQLLEGLQFLHRNRIAHSDIHLSNILLEKADTGNVVAKLSDGNFQHAIHQYDASAISSAAPLAGWMAPEIINGVGAVLPTDIWDLGICSHASPRDLIKNLELSPSLEELLEKAFKPDFKRRATAFDLLPAAFLRSEDPALVQPVRPAASLSRPFERSASDGNRRRRESTAVSVASRYRTDFVEAGRLGRGGFGEVVRARNKLDGRFYAVKKIKSRSASALNDVLSEIMILSQINHPYVVRYYNAWLENESEDQGDFVSQNQSRSTEDPSHSDINDGDADGNLGQAPSGLDFMSQSGPDINVVFESDSEECSNEEADSDTSSQAAEHDIPSEDESVADERDGNESANSTNKSPRSYFRARRDGTQMHSTKSTLYIQMEYCERKETLRDLITAEIHADNVESWRIFRQILEGLAHIHALFIVHRDLKPENIFIDADTDVRIGDFGLARHGDYQPSLKPTNMEEAYSSFTKSVGTSFYVAPEVRSVGRGKYNEKADMYSLGIIFFEMCVPMMTGMERVHILGMLREREHVLPPIFKRPEKSTQGDIIGSLLDHEPSRRPSSSELLASEQIPGEVENDKWTRNVLRHINEASYRKKLLAGLFPKPDELEASRCNPNETDQSLSTLIDSEMLDPDLDADFYPKIRAPEMTYNTKDRSNSPDELLLRNVVRDRITYIFQRHGAVQVDGPAIMPFSSHYMRKYDQIAKFLTSNDDFLQLPFDYTLPNAKLLAKAARSPRKTYTFGDVYREVDNGAPRRIAEADFDIISYNSLDHALREAEVIKVVDEIIGSFPSMVSLPMCYYINHSKLFNAILGFCNIHPSKWALVKDVLGSLHAGQSNWSKVRAMLRAPTVGVAATSVEELMRFDFRDTSGKAILRLRQLLRSKNIENLESCFTHIEALIKYLSEYKVSRKIFLSPLSSVNESFYRGHISFQCIFDSPKKEVFAAGGRYDELIRSQVPGYQPKSIREPHAVGFNFNWERLCTSMARYQKAHAKAKTKKRMDQEAFDFKMPSRCEVLVDSSDRGLLRSSGIDIVQGLWANDISAELIIDTEADEANSVYNPANESEYSYSWIVFIKQDGKLRIRNVAKKEESEVRVSELFVWLRNELRERDRSEGRTNVARFLRSSSQQDSGPSSGELDVRILTSSTKGKKFNRKTVIEQAHAVIKDTVNGFLECPVVAIEVKDETFERIRSTRLSDPDSWKRFIQNTPADDRAYLKEFQATLQDMTTENPGVSSAFVYNFRGKSCIFYDLG